jgi:alcohol dehydrogenase class IV
MDFNCESAPERFAAVARALGHSADNCSTAEAARFAVSSVCDLADAIGIPKGLSQYGLRDEHVSDVVKEAMKSGNVPVNPRTTSAEQLAGILRRTL